MKKPRVAAYAGTRNLYELMMTAAKSLLLHSNVDHIYFLIEDDKFPYKIPNYIEPINVSRQTYFRQDGPCMNSRWTWMVLMRAIYYDLFPDLDEILSLDADTFVEEDISDLWDLELTTPEGYEYYFAGSLEPAKTTDKFLYINFGVNFQNLKALRKGKGCEIKDIINTRNFSCPEQDVVNRRCQKHILHIPSSYNACDWTEPTDEKKIIHYAGIPQKDWINNPIVEKYRNISWRDLPRRKRKVKPRNWNKQFLM